MSFNLSEWLCSENAEWIPINPRRDSFELPTCASS